MITDWETEIAVAWRVLECTRQLDVAGLWEYHLPHLRATEQELRGTEAALGFQLDPVFRAFLAYANGWPDFYQTADLFGTRDLLDGPLMRSALELLSVTDDAVWGGLGVGSSGLLPIALAKHDKDLFAIVKPSHRFSGQVVWLAGTLIDRFADFGEFFLSMVDYNRLRFNRLRAKAGGGRAT
jgi:hypothetical protein